MGKGGKGGVELANQVLEVIEQPNDFKFLYDLDQSLEEKIETIVKDIYGGSSVTFSKKLKQLKNLLTMVGVNIQSVWLKLNIHSVMMQLL